MRVNFKDSQLNNKKDKNVSFAGYDVVKNDKGQPTLRFLLPYDTQKYNVKVQLVPVTKDPKGNFVPVFKDGKKADLEEVDFPRGQTYVDVKVSPEDLKKDSYLGYRFYLMPRKGYEEGKLKPYLDPGVRTKITSGYSKGDFSVIELGRPIMEAPRQMLHIIPDNFAPEFTTDENDNPKKIDNKKFEQIKKMQRTFYNKYDGNLKGVIAKLDDIKSTGAKRIMSTPVFGQDNISAFGYWTTNPYQVTSSLGDINDFKNLQVGAYKKGMGWIADGAFVNEGLNGVHVRDVLKNGDKSPFFYWFKSYLFPMNTFELGVLPTNKENFKNVGLNFVNSPKIYSVKNDNGSYKAVAERNPKYDSKKPTTIQIYPKGKVSQELLNKHELIKTADIKEADSYDVQAFNNSVHLYSFDVSPEELDKNYSKLNADLHSSKGKDGDTALLKAFSSYNNFTLVPKGTSKGLETWGGNEDILKLKFMISNQEKSQMSQLTDAKLDDKLNAVNQVQDYILQVGEFWTKETANAITEYTAKTIAANKKTDDSTGFMNAINAAVDNHQLDKDKVEKVNKKVINNVLDGSYELPSEPDEQNIENDLRENVIKTSMNYPLDAIEFNPDVTAILGSPYIKKLANSKEDMMKSRYDLSQDTSYDFVSGQYRKTYQAMDKFYRTDFESFAHDILILVDKKNSCEKIISNDKAELSDFGKALYPLIANDIVKFAVVKSLKNDAKVQFDKNGQLAFDPKELESVSAKSLGLGDLPPEQSAEKMVELLDNGIIEIPQEDKALLAENIAKRFEGVDYKTLQVAKAVVDKSESGLEWRIDAAKDIGNISDIVSNEDSFENVWGNVTDFWGRFATKVRENNRNAYIIGELTDVYKFFDSSWSVDKKGKYRNSGEAEAAFVEDSNFTTTTNYSYFFSLFQRMVGRNFEDTGYNDGGTDTGELRGNLMNGYTGTPGFLYSNPVDALKYSHVFMDNHDKPRMLHGYALDMNLFYSDLKSDSDMATARKFWGDDASREEMNPKSIAVGNVISSAIESDKQIDENKSEILNSALSDIVKGNYKGRKIDSTLFAVKPFDQSIDDVFAQASYKNPDFAKFTKDKNNEKEIIGMKNNIHENIMKPAFSKYLASLKMMVALPGAPAIFSGTEFGETGFESPDHNAFLQCRNRNHWEWISTGNKDNALTDASGKNSISNNDYKPYVAKFNKDIKEIFKLRDRKDLSPLTDGFTTVLQEQEAYGVDSNNKDNKWGVNTVALFRYNKDTDVIELFSKNGFGPSPNDCKPSPYKVNYIDLNKIGPEAGLQGGLTVGTTYVNALNKNDTNVYKVINHESLYMLKKFKDEGEYKKYLNLKDQQQAIMDIDKNSESLIKNIPADYGIKLKDKMTNVEIVKKIDSEIAGLKDSDSIKKDELNGLKDRLLSGDADKDEVVGLLNKVHHFDIKPEESKENVIAQIDKSVDNIDKKYSDLETIREFLNEDIQKHDAVLKDIEQKQYKIVDDDDKEVDLNGKTEKQISAILGSNINKLINDSSIDVNEPVMIFARKNDYQGNSFPVSFSGNHYINMLNKKYPTINSYNNPSGRSVN